MAAAVVEDGGGEPAVKSVEKVSSDRGEVGAISKIDRESRSPSNPGSPRSSGLPDLEGLEDTMSREDDGGSGGETLLEAVRSGRVDTRTGHYCPREGASEPCSLASAVRRGHVQDRAQSQQMSLSDALTRGLIDPVTGKFSDRWSGKAVRIGEAVKRGLLDPTRHEVYDHDERQKVTLSAALASGLIEEETGKYAMSDRKRVSLAEAAKRNFIYRPLTLKECDDNGLIEADNRVRDPLTDEVLTLLGAVGKGILDADTKSIRNVGEAKYVTLCEAVGKDIVDVESGDFKDDLGNAMPLSEAVKKGHLTTVTIKSIFDIEGIRDQATTGDFMSFNEALASGSIDKTSGRIVDKRTGEKLGFAEAAEKGLIQRELLDMLRRPIGVQGPRGELTLLEAVSEGRIDPHSGLVIDPATTNTVPMDRAEQRGMISPEGAAQLKSLLNITVTTATVTQSVRRFVKGSPLEESSAMRFEDALREGFIDEQRGVFTDPASGRSLNLDEAIDMGILKATTTSSSSMSMSRKTSSSAVVIEHSANGSRKESTSSMRSAHSRKTSTASSSSSTSSSPLRKLSSPLRGSPLRKDSHVDSLDTTFEAVTEVVEAVQEQQQFHVGYTLKEAMDKELLDATSGYFQESDWARGITFKEAVLGGHIEAKSASVIVDEEQPPMSLQKALDGGVLSGLGQFDDGRKTYTLQQAVRTGRVKHVRVTGGGRQSWVSSVASERGESPNLATSQRSASEEFVVHENVTPTELLSALKEGKLRPTDIMVKEKSGEGSLNILEAIRSGVIDRVTGDYNDAKGSTVNFSDAIKLGFVTFMGAKALAMKGSEVMQVMTTRCQGNTIKARVVQSGTTTTRISSFMVEVPGTGEEISLEEAVRRGVVSEETAKMYKAETTTDSEVISTVVLITDPNTGEEMESTEAVARGIVTEDEVAEFLRMKEEKQQQNGSHQNGGPAPARPTSLFTQNGNGTERVKVPSYQKLEPETTMWSKEKSSSRGSSPAKPSSRSTTPTKTQALSSKSPTPTSPMREGGWRLKERFDKRESRVERSQSTRVSTSSSAKSSTTSSPVKGSPSKQSSGSSSKFGSPAKGRRPASASSSSLTRSPSQKHRSRSRKRSRSSSSSSSSSSSAASGKQDNSYRSEISIDFDKSHSSTSEVVESSVSTTVVNLKQGYALSSLNDVRNLTTGETMSVYEAKLRGIAFDLKAEEIVTRQIEVFFDEAVRKGLLNIREGTFTNPTDGRVVSIGEAVKAGMLITDFSETTEEHCQSEATTVSFRDALQRHFDSETRKFKRGEDLLSLQEAVRVEWVNGNDILFDLTSDSQRTLNTALEVGALDGETCEYTVEATKERLFVLDAAKRGLLAVFPEPTQELELSDVTFTLQEAFENGVYNRSNNMFFEASSYTHISLHQSLKIGLIDFGSAKVKDTDSEETCNLSEAADKGLINMTTGTFRDMSLIEAFEKGLIVAVERGGSPFECITLWEAIERDQLDTESGMFHSVHEENKKMTLEEAVYRKYIEKKSAFVRDTWKRKYCSLSEASRKKVLKDGLVMNTTTGKWLTVGEAIEADIVVREIKSVSLIEALDYGMYQPYSGKIRMPGFDRDISLREAVEFKFVDHQKTIVKNRKSGRYLSTLEALRSGDLDGLTGMYCGGDEGDMNLLEARSRGYLLSNDALVTRRGTQSLPKKPPTTYVSCLMSFSNSFLSQPACEVITLFSLQIFLTSHRACAKFYVQLLTHMMT